MNSWQKIWNGFDFKNEKIKTDLRSLLIYARHISGKPDDFKIKLFKIYINSIVKRIQLINGNLLEIGCGSGAILKFFNNKMKLYGIDYSRPLLRIAKKALPNGQFKFRQANGINYKKNFFDSIIMFSCVQYFPNMRYFDEVLKKITLFLKPGGKLFIGEMCDRKMLSQFIKYRKKQLGLKKYKLLYEGKNKKLAFFSITKIKIYNKLKKDYKNILFKNCPKRQNENLFFRFNIFAEKRINFS
jgi:ubiquinone/menaquinone biosynthesis C-methylase UbiE